MDKPDVTFEEAWLPGPDGLSFYTRTYPALGSHPKGVVLFVHGFADHLERHEEDNKAWAAGGFTLFGYDARGFGRTALDEANRSIDSMYGKTSTQQTFQDLAWWIEHASSQFPDLPLFVVAYSANGGYALDFCTKPQHASQVAKLSGIITLGPLFLLTFPPPTLKVWAVKLVSRIVPWLTIPAPMPEERFSRNPDVVEALKRDPLRRPEGTAKGLKEMIFQCETLLRRDWKDWPKDLPVLIIHGTKDDVNSCEASVEFHEKLQAKDKRLTLIPDAYHDLCHEIDDIFDRVFKECLTWAESHCSRADPAPTNTGEGDVRDEDQDHS